MLLSTPGLVLHTTPYAETSVVVRVFTRLIGLRSYIVKGVRTQRGKVKQNLLQPLTSLDMVVYHTPHNDLNYIRELTPRHPAAVSDPVGNALRFFMTEVLYKALRDEEPLPDLFDYVDGLTASVGSATADAASPSVVPIQFLLTVARHLGIAPLDNHSPATPLFDLQEGRFVSLLSDTTLTPAHSLLLHGILAAAPDAAVPEASLADRTALVDALIAYLHLHLSGFSHFSSHHILHSVLR